MRNISWSEVDWSNTHCGSSDDQHHVGTATHKGKRYVALRIGRDSDDIGTAVTILLDEGEASDLAAMLRQEARSI